MSEAMAPRRPLSLRDVAVASACAVVAVGVLVILPLAASQDPALGELPRPGSGPWWLLVAVLVAQAIVLGRASAAPATVLAGVSALPLVLSWGAPNAAFSLTAVAVLVAAFLARLAGPPSTPLRVVVPLAVLLVATGQFLNDLRSGVPGPGAAAVGAALQALVVVLGPLVPAVVIAARRDARRARAQEMQALRREQAALLRAAVSTQRAAMSRELHDIAAHHMSGIALMAAALDRQIESDPVGARGSARRIRHQSTAVLDDLRRLVGLLRDDAELSTTTGAVEEPGTVETVAGVPALVATRRAAGATIDLVRRGGADGGEDGDRGNGGSGLGPVAQLVVHRTVQEALANAARHAPGARCLVEIDERDPDRLAVLVRNEAPSGHAPAPAAPGGGFGLLGMGERARLVGGELDYGATAAGGWEVTLSVPRAGTLATAPESGALPEELA